MASAEVERVRRLTDGLRRDRRTHPYRGMREYSRRAQQVAAECGALIDTEPGSVPTLARRAVDRVTNALMYLDDSSGIVGDDLRALMAVHARACAAAPPDPRRLAVWLAKLRLEGPGWPDFELRDYAGVLGQKGRAELMRILGERAKAAEPGGFGSTSFGIRVMREQLAEISGDVDHHVAVLSEDLRSASQYLKIVTVLRDAGRVSDAEHWAQRGLGIGNPIDQDKLRDTYVALLLERGAREEALALWWEVYDQNPVASRYRSLRRTAEWGGGWGDLRMNALDRIRDATAHQPGYADHLIEVLLDEGDLDEAWRKALEHTDDLSESRWHSLIELRQPTHPEDVIEPWQRLIQQRLDTSADKYRYSKAVRMLGKLQDAYQACGNATGFETYLDGLREQHKRKTAFLAKLDRAGL